MKELDVIIPYNELDRHLVHEAIDSILEQTGCYPIIHLVADNCQPIPIEHNQIIHHTTPGIGPYHITNKLIPQLQTDYIAIQDADDISFSDRLSLQLEILTKYDMTSFAMKQLPIEGYSGTRHIREPIIYPGTRLVLAPMGRCINSTRTMKKDFFIKLNGFGNYPCSGDFQFDNRSLFTNHKVHFGTEVKGIRRLRPNSLSNGGAYAFETASRNKIAWQVMMDLQTIRKTPTLEHAREQGFLNQDISPSR